MYIFPEINCATLSSVEESSTIPETTEEGVSFASYEHHSSILKTLYDDSTFADVTLTAEGHVIRAHKVLLLLHFCFLKWVVCGWY